MSSTPLSRIAAAVFLACACATSPARAQTARPDSAAFPTQQVPGYYVQKIGTLRVTALFDGTVSLPLSDLHGISATQARALLRNAYVPETDKGLQTSVTAYLIQNGTRLMLVDTGAQACFGPGLGQVLANLQRAGYRPEQVNDILITHAHPDHLCGILDAEGKRAYAALADAWRDQVRVMGGFLDKETD